MASCPFKILSVPKTATLNEIKIAYRRLALQLHPDTNGGDKEKSEKFKVVTSAYNTLSNPTERRRYEEEQQQRPGVHHYDGRSGPSAYHYQHQPGGAHFNEEEWLAYNFGIGDDEFDFFGPETIIFDASTGTTHRTSKKPKGKKKKEQDFEDRFQEFTAEEIENIIRHSARTQRSPMSQKGPKGDGGRGGGGSQKRGSNPGRGGGSRGGGGGGGGGGGRGRGGGKKRNNDSDCVVS
jgi:curved DNA-binding protein CbpA